MAVLVVIHGDKWAVKTSNGSQAYMAFDTQAEAIQCGIEVAKNNKCD